MTAEQAQQIIAQMTPQQQECVAELVERVIMHERMVAEARIANLIEWARALQTPSMN